MVVSTFDTIYNVISVLFVAFNIMNSPDTIGYPSINSMGINYSIVS